MLVLDYLTHAYTVLDNPLDLGYGYEKIYAWLTAAAAGDKPQLWVLFLGGGGYIFP